MASSHHRSSPFGTGWTPRERHSPSGSGYGPGSPSGEEEVRAYVPLRQDHTRGGRRHRGGNPALGDRLLRFTPVEPRDGHLRGLPAGAGRGHRKQGPRDRTSLPPHRNEILERTSTPEELEYLRTETPPHMRRPPS